MSDHNEKMYDEVTFALFYDNELDAEEERAFVAQLKQDSTLMEAYEDWVEGIEAVSQHIKHLESDYELDQFTASVMAALPEQSPWRSKTPTTKVDVDIESEQSWLKSWLTPILIGGLTAAAILIVARTLETQTIKSQRSTVLINYPDQSEAAQEAPVIWLLDEEELLEEANEHDTGIDTHEEDI